MPSPSQDGAAYGEEQVWGGRRDDVEHVWFEVSIERQCGDAERAVESGVRENWTSAACGWYLQLGLDDLTHQGSESRHKESLKTNTPPFISQENKETRINCREQAAKSEWCSRGGVRKVFRDAGRSAVPHAANWSPDEK